MQIKEQFTKAIEIAAKGHNLQFDKNRYNIDILVDCYI